ncbi:MAG: NAD(P)H-dependent oxidoreductase [Candidatus Heimdallarchaeota archaeon]
MKKIMKKILISVLKYLPFVAITILSVLAGIFLYDIDKLRILVIVIASVLLINLIASITLRVNDYFIYGTSVIAILGSIFVFAVPSIGQLYLENVIASLYLGLFCVAFFPPLFKLKPFTYSFSEGDYPEVIAKSKKFLKINLIINYIWAILFAGAFFLTIIKYSNEKAIQMPLSIALPIIIQVGIGIPAIKKLPAILMDKISNDPMHFSSIKELFEAQPMGLNKQLAKDLDIVVQFLLTGDEPTDGYLTIKNSTCTYANGVHPSPTTTIKAESKLWLGISNNEISGTKAYINKEYEVEGDMSILMEFNSLFAPTKKEEKVRAKDSTKKVEIKYSTVSPGEIKKVFVFDSGPRNRKLSKTSFMVDQFIEGVEAAGAQVEYFKLKDYDIKDCTGCYTCWTKTPGQCIFKDDMSTLRMKYREADLIVFASPLYIFNVNGIMKRFLDRLLPIMKPYMVIDDHGFIKHPDRYPELGEQGFVVFSAAGFPDIENNYDGLTSMFKMLDLHNDHQHMMGEFYLPAAEPIVQPIYSDRFIRIADLCRKSGEQIIKEGKVNPSYMKQITEHDYTLERFQEESNFFWESLDGKSSYLKVVPKIK